MPIQIKALISGIFLISIGLGGFYFGYQWVNKDFINYKLEIAKQSAEAEAIAQKTIAAAIKKNIEDNQKKEIEYAKKITSINRERDNYQSIINKLRNNAHSNGAMPSTTDTPCISKERIGEALAQFAERIQPTLERADTRIGALEINTDINAQPK